MSIPTCVLEAYGYAAYRIETVSGGLINATYQVKGDDGTPVAALQRLHPIFAAEVNLDIEAITSVLAGKGLPTPRLLRTVSGEAWVESDGHIWRSISWIEGRCYSQLPRASVARSGAALVGRFHRAVSDLDYDFQFTRAGVHDTAAHFARLQSADTTNFAEFAEVDALRGQVLQQATQIPEMPSLPLRICHGDLKLSNLLFDASNEGLCLVDLDTMGRQTIAYELGDALRSWGNLGGEDQRTPQIDIDVVEQAARGYAEGAKDLLSTEEVHSVIVGLETICLELAARFCVDIFDDRYFGWDASRYESRRAHNLVRASGQLALCRAVASQRDELQARWSQAF